jgi:hypothetical protein
LRSIPPSPTLQLPFVVSIHKDGNSLNGDAKNGRLSFFISDYLRRFTYKSYGNRV